MAKLVLKFVLIFLVCESIFVVVVVVVVVVIVVVRFVLPVGELLKHPSLRNRVDGSSGQLASSVQFRQVHDDTGPLARFGLLAVFVPCGILFQALGRGRVLGALELPPFESLVVLSLSTDMILATSMNFFCVSLSWHSMTA